MKSSFVPVWLHGLLLSACLASALPQVTRKPSALAPPAALAVSTGTITLTYTIDIPTSTVTETTTAEITITATSVGPTATVTETTTKEITTTATSPCPTAAPPGYCGNAGLAYAIQTHTFTNAPAPAYPSLVVDYFKTARPVQQGIVPGGVGFVHRPAFDPISIYGGPNRTSNFIAVNHRGYFVPATSGTYTFQVTNHDDLTLLWVGNNALNGAYTRANANMEVRYQSDPPLSGSYSVSLTAGTPVPVRFLAINAQGVGWNGFTLTIRDPSGTIILDQNKGSLENFVQYTCNGSLYAWRPFGQEA